MKKMRVIIVAALILGLLMSSAAIANPAAGSGFRMADYPVLVNGAENKDVKFLNRSGTTYVPLQLVGGLLGVELQEGKLPSVVHNDTTYVALRAACQLLGVDIKWNDQLRRVEISKAVAAKSQYADGRYRGIFQDSGVQQVSIQFHLKNDIIHDVTWRHLFYSGIDYRKMQQDDPLYPIVKQHEQIRQFLEGKHISIVKAPNNVFANTAAFVDDIDGFTAATIRGTKISSAIIDGLNRGIYDPRGNELIRTIGEYDNGRYRGTFGDSGYQQVSVQFHLKDNIIHDVSFRHLFYSGVDYRALKEGDERYPILKQHQQIAKHLEGKPLVAIFDLHNPGAFIDDIDGFTGATVRANKVFSAIMDGLNRGIYDPRSNPINIRVGSHADGRYRGAFGDSGIQQVSVEFNLKDNVITRFNYRWLFYRDVDYRKLQEGDQLYPVRVQFEQIASYLVGKPLEAIYDLHNPGNFIEDIDGFTGATVRANKVFSAIMDGLNRGIY